LLSAADVELFRGSHLALGASDGVGVRDHLTLRGVADDFLAIGLESHDAGVVFVPSGFGMTLTLPSPAR
jgi:hypothetical protein